MHEKFNGLRIETRTGLAYIYEVSYEVIGSHVVWKATVRHSGQVVAVLEGEAQLAETHAPVARAIVQDAIARRIDTLPV